MKFHHLLSASHLLISRSCSSCSLCSRSRLHVLLLTLLQLMIDMKSQNIKYQTVREPHEPEPRVKYSRQKINVALKRSVCGLITSERSGSASSRPSLLPLSSSCSLFRLASSALRLACSSASRAKLACFCRRIYGRRKMVVYAQ